MIQHCNCPLPCCLYYRRDYYLDPDINRSYDVGMYDNTQRLGVTMRTDKNITFDTLLLVAAVCLVAGFIGGVAYGIFYASKSVSPGSEPSEQNTAALAGEIVSMQKAVKENPNDPDGWILLGNAYFDADRHLEAIDAYKTALALDPHNANVWTDLGVMYRRSDQPEKAIEAFDSAIAADPTHEVSRFNKGIVLMHDLNDKENAVKTWNALLLINPAATAPGGMPITELVRQIEMQPSEK